MLLMGADINDLAAVRIRDARNDAHLTQAAAADLVGLSQSSWASYERGKVDIPIGMLHRIAKVLGKPIEYFVVEDYEYTVKAPIPKVESPGARAKKKKAA